MIRLYALLSYLFFLATLLYFVGWLADVAVPRGLRDGPSASASIAVIVDCALLGAFAIQHSVMARPWFKRRWAAVMPVAAERATYVLLSSAAVVLIALCWLPLNQDIWNVRPPAARTILWAGYGTGWAVVVSSTFMIGHFDLFGLRQAAQGPRYREQSFGRPGFYAWVRHPIMTGFILAFWLTPRMTLGHLLFAGASTLYIIVAVRLEERDLQANLGEDYASYARQVPRFVPRPSR